MNFDKSIPSIIQFSSFGTSSFGYITVAENMKEIPINILRAYWTYFTPQNLTRGGHANVEKEMVLIAVAGQIRVKIETISNLYFTFEMSKPDIGVFIPKLAWHTMEYSHNAVQLVLASNYYNELDYIRDYNDYKRRQSLYSSPS